MNKFLFAIALLICTSYLGYSQRFWVENFESGSSTGMLVTAYVGPNGAWTQSIGTEGDQPNVWYVSCAENGHTTGVCGTGCAAVSTTATGATLHIGGNPGGITGTGDLGASYDAGGFCGLVYCTNTDRKAISPVINCTGKYTITMSFYYIEAGETTNDDASVYYSADAGLTWSLLVNPAKTLPICPLQGYWTHYSYPLPSSADNNPNVKIAFRWVNNDDGIGTDPSVAIDSISLSASTTTTAASFTTNLSTTCQDSCIIFTNTSSGAIDSLTWSMPGVTIAHPHGNIDTICFSTPGTHDMTLTVYHGGTAYTSIHTVTIIPTPSPAITVSGHTLSVSGAYTTYQWYNGTTPIAGATTNSYTFPGTGTYTVIVDSAGCPGFSTPYVFNPLAIEGVNKTNDYRVTFTSTNSLKLFATDILDENLNIGIYDAAGRELFTDVWNKGTEFKSINNLVLPEGIYLVRLSNLQTSVVLRFAK